MGFFNDERRPRRPAISRVVAISVAAGFAAAALACAGTPTKPDDPPRCAEAPQRVRTAGKGPEDIVALPMPGGGVRLFVREGCREKPCEAEGARIGYVDIGADGRATSAQTELAWRPHGAFEPLGLSLEADPARPGRGRLTLLDSSPPAKVWRLEIVDGRIQPPAVPWFTEAVEDGPLSKGNDLQAAGDVVHVTRFDFFGLLRTDRPGWPGLLRLQDGQAPAEQADGLRGANGIAVIERSGELIVANYWGRRLLRIDAASGAILGEASAELPFHPDNLTLADGRLWIAGQPSAWRTGLHLFGLPVGAPSAVYVMPVDALGPAGEPRLVWADDGTQAQAVSVAVPVPGGLALGQITAPDVLLLRCSGG